MPDSGLPTTFASEKCRREHIGKDGLAAVRLSPVSWRGSERSKRVALFVPSSAGACDLARGDVCDMPPLETAELELIGGWLT